MEKFDLDDLSKGIAKHLASQELFTPEEIQQAIKSARIDFNKQYEKPKTSIEFYEDNGHMAEVLTLSNISTTIGAAKSKKTFFSTMLLASLLGSNEYAIKGITHGKNIVFFDTEQSPYHVQKIVWRLKQLCNEPLQGIEILMLREFMPEMRLAIINKYLETHNGQYSFVIIDGIVDLLYDFNDITESKRISTKLMEWSAKYNCHINSILHTNKDQKNARGHLGTELMNKSETVFRINKTDQSISEIICEMSRNSGFKTFAFTIEKGLPKRLEYPNNYFDNKPKKVEETIINRYDKQPGYIDLSEGIEPDMIF